MPTALPVAEVRQPLDCEAATSYHYTFLPLTILDIYLTSLSSGIMFWGPPLFYNPLQMIEM